MIEGGYVVTNYHVVWPHESDRVVFPDGAELLDVPVLAWDPMTDLAVLGPVQTNAPALKLQDGESMAIGSELLLVGYPGEVDQFPQTTVVRGVLSRYRHWEQAGMTYLQTDATIAGGRSGGALVNLRGEVVGITGLYITEAMYGLAASAADIDPIVAHLIRGEDPWGLGRRLPSGPGSFNVSVDMRNQWDTRTFVFDASEGTRFEAEIEGTGDGAFQVSDQFGLLLEVDDDFTGIERGRTKLVMDGVHFLQVELASRGASTFDLTSNVRLTPLKDPDDGRTVAVGETIAGNLDYFDDWDWYSIWLDEGETVRISADSLNFDTMVYVDFPGAQGNQVVYDDDSGGGFLEVNALLVYRAPKTGEYYIAVGNATEDYDTGGYFLSVESYLPGMETVTVPPSPEVVDSPFGEMLIFEDPQTNLSIQVPADWAGELNEGPDYREYLATSLDGSTVFMIAEKDFSLELGERSVTELGDELVSSFLDEGFQVHTRETIPSPQGFPTIRITGTISEESHTVDIALMVYLSEDGSAFAIVYGFHQGMLDKYWQLIEYSFGTFRVN